MNDPEKKLISDDIAEIEFDAESVTGSGLIKKAMLSFSGKVLVGYNVFPFLPHHGR